MLASRSLPLLDVTFGAILLGTFIGLLLYGLTVHQAYHYFRSYPTDNLFLKTTVILLFLTDTLHCVECIHINYHYLVASYFQPLALYYGIWSIRLLIPTTSFMILITQTFYARRVYRLGAGYQYTLIPILAAIGMTVSTGFCIAATIETFVQVTLVRWASYTWLICGIWGSAVATDIMLTTTLIAYLRSRRTGYKQTDSILRILTIYTINTGLLTGTLNAVSLAFARAQPTNLIYGAISIPTTKSYAISVLSVLNSRRPAVSDLLASHATDDFASLGMHLHPQRTAYKGGDIEPATDGVIDIRARMPQGADTTYATRIRQVEALSAKEGSPGEGEGFEMKPLRFVDRR